MRAAAGLVGRRALRGSGRTVAAPQPAADATPVAAAAGERPPRPEGQNRTHRFRDFKRPGGGEGGPSNGRDGHRGPPRDAHGNGGESRGGGRDRRDGPPGGSRRDGGRAPSFQTTEAPRPRERDRQPDPNSPFAKLAALKAQMEKDRT